VYKNFYLILVKVEKYKYQYEEQLELFRARLYNRQTIFYSGFRVILAIRLEHWKNLFAVNFLLGYIFQ
jgi:hypothetical protein